MHAAPRLKGKLAAEGEGPIGPIHGGGDNRGKLSIIGLVLIRLKGPKNCQNRGGGVCVFGQGQGDHPRRPPPPPKKEAIEGKVKRQQATRPAGGPPRPAGGTDSKKTRERRFLSNTKGRQEERSRQGIYGGGGSGEQQERAIRGQKVQLEVGNQAGIIRRDTQTASTRNKGSLNLQF